MLSGCLLHVELDLSVANECVRLLSVKILSIWDPETLFRCFSDSWSLCLFPRESVMPLTVRHNSFSLIICSYDSAIVDERVLIWDSDRLNLFRDTTLRKLWKTMQNESYVICVTADHCFGKLNSRIGFLQIQGCLISLSPRTCVICGIQFVELSRR